MAKRMMAMLPLVLVVLLFSAAADAAPKKGGSTTQRVILSPDQLQWKQGPPELGNTQVAVLEGNPAKAGFFVIRLKVAPGTKIPPHIHDNVERVTVISGTVHLAMGKGAENGVTLPAGSYFSLPPKTVHNAWVDEETVLQISTNGPWTFQMVGKPAGSGSDQR